jgi:hypothetical protein
LVRAQSYQKIENHPVTNSSKITTNVVKNITDVAFLEELCFVQ